MFHLHTNRDKPDGRARLLTRALAMHSMRDYAVAAVDHFSIERLIRLAFKYHLLTDYRMTPALIELCHEDSSVEMDPEEARFFLRGLIYGFMCAEARTEV